MTTITKDGIEFSYTIKSVDVENSHIIVEYDPVHELLMPYTFNVPFIEFREWTMTETGPVEVNANKPFSAHLEYSVTCGAPIDQWRRQLLLINNIDQLPL